MILLLSTKILHVLLSYLGVLRRSSSLDGEVINPPFGVLGYSLRHNPMHQ